MSKTTTANLVCLLAVLLVMSPLLASDQYRSHLNTTRLVNPGPAQTIHRSATPPVQLPMQIETILLVDDDGGPNNGGTYLDIQSYFANALTGAGHTYDDFVVDWSITSPPQDGPTATEMAEYDCVIWFTGETWGYYGVDVLTAVDETNLATYLDGGGTLFLNAQDYLYASYPSAGPFSAGQFPYDYLGISSASQDAFDPPVTVQGAAGGYAEGLSYTCLNPYPSATLWSDQLTPMDHALLNADGGSNACAAQYDGTTFYTAFSTCGVEGLVDGTHLVSAYVDAVLTGFGEAGVILSEEPTVVTGYLLDQNFPNPFNPTTDIKYQLPASGIVTLTVYNAMGQEVATLIDQNQNPGAYRVSWNANNLPTGIYFYQLQVNDFQDVRRMMLLK